MYEIVSLFLHFFHPKEFHSFCFTIENIHRYIVGKTKKQQQKASYG